jgi:transcription elongation factor Elf1
MSENIKEVASEEILETDIVFECPHCSKSMAIDYHGAGLTIPCIDCKELVEVPIPDGMDMSDLDSSESDLEVRLINLRKILKDTESKMTDLKDSNEKLLDKNSKLERQKAIYLSKITPLMNRLDILSENLSEVIEIMNIIAGSAEVVEDE